MRQANFSETNHRDALIDDHWDMAICMARRMAQRLPRSVNREDLESAALLGLTEAACRYEQGRAEPFMAFACKRVRGAILDHLRRNDVLTRRGREAERRVNAVRRTLEAERGRTVSDTEVAEQMGMSDQEFHATFAAVRDVAVVGLEEPDSEAEISTWQTTPTEYIEQQQLRAALRRALERLDERQILVLSCYYQDGLTLREIGEVLGISESRVCQIHSQALRELREQLA